MATLCTPVVLAGGDTAVTGTFDWAKPVTLTPAYRPLSMSDRYGDYIGGVVFTDHSVALTIDDGGVREQSQRARFVYGYNTQCTEMRAYPGSDIIVSAPKGYDVTAVTFTGAKVGADYTTPYDAASRFDGGTWTAAQPDSVARFYVDVTINCTMMTVTCHEHGAGLADITVDNEQPSAWIALDGVQYATRPEHPGVYVVRNGDKAKPKAVVVK